MTYSQQNNPFNYNKNGDDKEKKYASKKRIAQKLEKGGYSKKEVRKIVGKQKKRGLTDKEITDTVGAVGTGLGFTGVFSYIGSKLLKGVKSLGK